MDEKVLIIHNTPINCNPEHLLKNLETNFGCHLLYFQIFKKGVIKTAFARDPYKTTPVFILFNDFELNQSLSSGGRLKYIDEHGAEFDLRIEKARDNLKKRLDECLNASNRFEDYIYYEGVKINSTAELRNMYVNNFGETKYNTFIAPSKNEKIGETFVNSAHSELQQLEIENENLRKKSKRLKEEKTRIENDIQKLINENSALRNQFDETKKHQMNTYFYALGECMYDIIIGINKLKEEIECMNADDFQETIS